MQHRLLFIDDELEDLQLKTEFFERRGYFVVAESSPRKAIERIKQDPEGFSVVVVDYQMGELNGAQTTEALLKINPSLLIIVSSGNSSAEAVLSTVQQAKAKVFIQKSEGVHRLLSEIENQCRHYEENLPLTPHESSAEAERLIASVGMVGGSQKLAEVAKQILALRGVQTRVLILGETGVGKEMVAQALKRPDSTEPFVAVNCATFNPSLTGAELFGYEKGAFTGAAGKKKGLFEVANGGTIFLDEIHMLPREVQSMLLRVTATGDFTPVGGDFSKPTRIKVRIIAAGKPDLPFLSPKEFLPDLYERLAITTIKVPALRERPEDIRPLLHAFSEFHNKELGTSKAFVKSTLPYLERYPWPGNVRELHGLVENLFVIVQDDKIRPSDLPEKLGGPTKTKSLKAQVEEFEQGRLIEALKNASSQREVARKLEVASSTITYLCKKYKIDPERYLGKDPRGSAS